MTCGNHALRALLVGLLVGFPAWRVVAQTPGSSTRVPVGARQPAFRADGMVPLPGGRLLVWAANGRLQMGAPGGGWSPVVRLPMTYVTSVVPEGEGALVGGSNFPRGGREHALALTVDAQGVVRTRWRGGEGLFNSVSSFHGKRWAVALDELVELLPEGRIQTAGKVPALSQLLVGPKGQHVLCQPANLTLAHGAPAECSSSSPVEWHITGTWKSSPLTCGEWFVTKEGNELSVRTLSSGRDVVRSASQAEILACGREGELLVAGRQVQILALPSLELLWAAPCGRNSVVALAATPDGVVCLDSKGIVRSLKGKDSHAPFR